MFLPTFVQESCDLYLLSLIVPEDWERDYEQDAAKNEVSKRAGFIFG